MNSRIRQKRATQWLAHVAQWRQSGMNKAAHCTAHGLNFSSFKYWLRKSRSVPVDAPIAVPLIVPLPFALAAKAPSIGLLVGNRYALHVPADFDEATPLAPRVGAWIENDTGLYERRSTTNRHPLRGPNERWQPSNTPLASRISAGFPSPADDYIEAELDLNRYMIRNPPDTFMVRVKGDALSGAGILEGDVLIVDRSKGPRHGMIVVAVDNGEMCVRRLNRKNRNWVLDPENRDFQPLRFRPGQDLEIWGVVTGMVRKCC